MIAIGQESIAAPGGGALVAPGRWRRGARLARRKRLGTLGAAIILFFLGVAILGPGLRLGTHSILPRLASQNPNATRLAGKLKAPSSAHWFGTDQLGRDVFTRVVYGVRPSIVVGFLASVLGVGLGTLIGLVSGYGNRWLDLIIQRTVDGLMSFPPLVLLLTLASVFGASLMNIAVILVVFVAPSSSRVIRSAVLGFRNCAFVEAARTVGVPGWRILLRHVLPNVFAPVLVLMSVVVGSAILVEAAASFLGFGIAPPNASLGSMLSGNTGTAMIAQPWMALAPGIAISLIVLAFNLLGDALRDVLDPRLRGST
jgi:peptide/nickel transport system permease protein